MRFITIILILLTVGGCNGSSLRPDNTPLSSIDAGYPTMELYIDGKPTFGSAILYKEKLDFTVAVQGYYTGEVRIVSENCDVDRTVHYEKNAMVPLIEPTGEVLKRNCFFAITLAPDLPNDTGSGLLVSAIRGFVAVKAKTEDRQAFVRTLKTANPAHGLLHLQVGNVRSARIVLSGCGRRYDQSLIPKDGIVDVPLEEAIQPFQGYCVLDGVAITEEFQDLLLSVAVASYASTFVPMSIPTIEWQSNGKVIFIRGEEAVTLVSLNKVWIVSNKLQTNSIVRAGSMIRLFSVKGRMAIGTYDGREFLWVQ